MNYFSRGSFQRLFTLFVMGKSFTFISEIDYIELVVILFILPSKQTLGKRPQLISSSARIKGTLNPVYLKGNLFYLIFIFLRIMNYIQIIQFTTPSPTSF